MYWYLWFLLCSSLLAFIYLVRAKVRKRYVRKSWIERLETIARDNHILWSTHLPYSQKERLCRELKQLEEESKTNEINLNLGQQGDWNSNINLLQYPSVKRLFSKLLPTITAYSRTLGLDPKFLTISAQAKIERKPLLKKIEKNENALFSGTYFLKASFEAKQKEGTLRFYRKEPSSQILTKFHPQAGDLLLYPSDMAQEMSTQSSGQFIRISFDVHFGTRKKSWMISKVIQSKSEALQDPFYEQKGDYNFNPSEKVKERAYPFFHVSKIKKKSKK